MKVNVELTVYELDSAEGNHKPVFVESHWNRTDVGGFVVLVVKGHRYAVGARELREAVDRCSGFGP